MIISKKNVVIFAILVVILGAILGILARNNHLPWQVNRNQDNLEDKSEDNVSEKTKPVKQSGIILQQALEIAEKTVQGKAYNLERETEGGKPVIEVGIDGKEIFVDAQTGEIHSIENLLEKGDSEDIEEITETMELQKLAIISIQEAMKAAENFAGGKAHTVQLENEDGNLVYEVVIDLQEIYVDAGNGKVLFTETIGKKNIVDNEGFRGSISIPKQDDN